MHPCQDSLEHLKRSVYISIVPKFQVVYIKKLDLCPIKSLVVKLRKSLKFCNSVKTTQLDSDNEKLHLKCSQAWTCQST